MFDDSDCVGLEVRAFLGTLNHEQRRLYAAIAEHHCPCMNGSKDDLFQRLIFLLVRRRRIRQRRCRIGRLKEADQGTGGDTVWRGIVDSGYRLNCERLTTSRQDGLQESNV